MAIKQKGQVIQGYCENHNYLTKYPVYIDNLKSLINAIRLRETWETNLNLKKVAYFYTKKEPRSMEENKYQEKMYNNSLKRYHMYFIPKFIYNSLDAAGKNNMTN